MHGFGRSVWDAAVLNNGSIAVFTPKISFDGDSISAQITYGFVNRWMTNTPSVTTTNLSVAGATIAQTENATNYLNLRVSTVAAFAPTLHVIAIGTNDLKTLSAATFLSRLTTHLANLRSAGVTGKIAVCGIPPMLASVNSNVNAQRGTVNATLRSWVGTNIDAYIPRGEHPVYDIDTGPANTAWWNADGIHPLQLVHRAYWQMMHDVLDPYVANSTSSDPTTIPLPSIADAPLSTLSTMRGRVTGMALGHAATMTVSGGPSTALGTGAFDTASKAVMNGDLVLVQQTSSGSNSTTDSGTLGIGTLSRAWNLTTQPASFPATTTTLDPTRKAATVTLSNGNLTVTGGSSGSFSMAMATAQPATDLVYFEVLAGSVGDTVAGKLVSVHSSALISNYTKLPGQSAGYENAGVSLSFPGTAGNYAIYSQGATNSSQTSGVDYLIGPTITAGQWIGVAFQKSTGRTWFQVASGVWLHGDPAVFDGGHAPATAISAYGSVSPKTNLQTETVNYGGTGASAFAYPVPLGFRPHC